MTLVNQPTKAPTRKMAAVIISGMICGAITGGLNAAFPGTDFSDLITELAAYVTPGIMGLVGYMTKERA